MPVQANVTRRDQQRSLTVVLQVSGANDLPWTYTTTGVKFQPSGVQIVYQVRDSDRPCTVEVSVSGPVRKKNGQLGTRLGTCDFWEGFFPGETLDNAPAWVRQLVADQAPTWWPTGADAPRSPRR